MNTKHNYHNVSLSSRDMWILIFILFVLDCSGEFVVCLLHTMSWTNQVLVMRQIPWIHLPSCYETSNCQKLDRGKRIGSCVFLIVLCELLLAALWSQVNQQILMLWLLDIDIKEIYGWLIDSLQIYCVWGF